MSLVFKEKPREAVNLLDSLSKEKHMKSSSVLPKLRTIVTPQAARTHRE